MSIHLGERGRSAGGPRDRTGNAAGDQACCQPREGKQRRVLSCIGRAQDGPTFMSSGGPADKFLPDDRSYVSGAINNLRNSLRRSPLGLGSYFLAGPPLVGGAEFLVFGKL